MATALTQQCFYPTDDVHGAKWTSMFNSLTADMVELSGAAGLTRLWKVFSSPEGVHFLRGAVAPQRVPTSHGWIGTALSLLVNTRLRKRLQNGESERGRAWTFGEVRYALESAFLRMLTHPDLQEGNMANFIACLFLHQNMMPRDACRPTPPVPPPPVPQAAKGSGGKKAKKGCVKAVPVPKSVPVSTWNAFDMLTGLDDTEDTESLSAMSDGTVEIMVASEDSAVSVEDSAYSEEDSPTAEGTVPDADSPTAEGTVPDADNKGCGIGIQSIDASSALVNKLAQLMHLPEYKCLVPDDTKEGIESLLTDYLLQIYMSLCTQVDQVTEFGTQPLGNSVASALYKDGQEFSRLLFGKDTTEAVFQHYTNVMRTVHRFIETCTEGEYRDKMTASYFHRQMDTAIGLKDVLPPGCEEVHALLLQIISGVSCGVLLLEVLLDGLLPGRPSPCGPADAKYLGIIACSLADSSAETPGMV